MDNTTNGNFVGLSKKPLAGARLKLGNNYYEFDSFNTSSTWYKTSNDFNFAIFYPIDALCRIADTPEKKILDSKKSIFSNGSIGSPISITAINDYVTTYNGLMDKLSLKDSVMTFIKLLTSGRVVTIIDINQDVFDWLKTLVLQGKSI